MRLGGCSRRALPEATRRLGNQDLYSMGGVRKNVMEGVLFGDECRSGKAGLVGCSFAPKGACWVRLICDPRLRPFDRLGAGCGLHFFGPARLARLAPLAGGPQNW